MTSLLKYGVRASSMGYSIVLCTLLSILCYSLLLISSYQELHKAQLQARSELAHTLVQAERYYLNKLPETKNQNRSVDILENSMFSNSKLIPWGGYDVLTTTASFKGDTLSRSKLVGQAQDHSLALYLTDRGKPLQLSGNSEIRGTKYIPNSALKLAYLSEVKTASLSNSTGETKKSKKKLPLPIKVSSRFENLNAQVNNKDLKNSKTIYHPFSKRSPLKLQVNNILENVDISGYVIIKSMDSLYIDQSAMLDNVLIEAPVITIGKNFKGAAQIYAQEAVYLEENVKMTYPSSIYLKSRVQNPKIILNENSTLLGGVVLNNNSNEFMREGSIHMDTGSVVVGGVYCSGSFQLEGTVIGTVYTEQFYLKTSSGIYDNYINNGVINREKLPLDFIMPSIFPKAPKSTSYEAIKGV